MMLKNRHILAAMGVMTGMLALAQPAAVMAGTTTSTEYQQINHYNTPAGFMNDIQTLFKGADGYFHLYYLLNSNYKSDNDGTEWYHVRTRDWEHFENQGVAIPKFTHGWSAVATGSVIDNASGFFKDLPTAAIVAYFTSYTESGQHQYAAYSLDFGKSYVPYNGGQPVLKGTTATSDNRDPYIWHDAARGKLMMYLAEGDKIGVYASSDGKAWTYEGATILNAGALGGKDLGLVECPNLKTMKASDGTTKHVLFFGANGYQYGSTTGTYYMVGHLDDKNVFVAESQPRRVDQGTDWYGANFLQESDTTVKALAWLGNWAYLQGDIRDQNGEASKHLSGISMTRNLTLVREGDAYVIKSAFENGNPKTSVDTGFADTFNAKMASDNYHKVLYDVKRWTSQDLNLAFTGVNGRPVNGHIRIFLNQADSTVFIDYDADNGQYEVRRTSSRISGDAKANYEKSMVVSSGYASPASFRMNLVVDRTSVELVYGNGESYSLTKLSTENDMGVLIETSGENRLDYSMSNLEGK